MTATMTLRKGKGSLKHNKRAFVAKNVDRKRTPLNKNIIDEDIKQVYDNLFGKVLEEYNARQTRASRQINNYYEHISRSKQEKPFYELIVAIGDINNSDELNDRSVKILQEFVDEIKSKYSSNVKFFGAYIHMDEATPHLHLDYIPFCTNQKRGLKTRNSHNLAMKELGFTDYKEWHTELFEILEQISKRHNVYRNNLHSEKRPNIDINTYRAVAQKLDGAIDDILEEKTKEIKLSSDLSKGEKTLGGKGVKSEVYDSVVDTANKLANFECIATNELIPRRLEIQKFNNKCKYQSGYICGDITQKDIQSKLFDEVDFWKVNENLDRVDVVIATPPCQGMSVANHKKREDEIVRNSLVVESIKIVQKLNPKFFVFENVPAFMKTICTDIDGNEKPISEAIEYNLGNNYSYVSRVINFKNYGACSSRQRTVVIGVSNDYAEEVSPYELYPDYVLEPTLRDVIGDLKPLYSIGEIDPKDIYHSFRKYPEHMRNWIHDLKEGESAFDNEDDKKKPHQIKDGKFVLNKRKNADKYTRQYWDKVGPCIHTRNDQLASQNTIHPSDDRVFSVRELMRMMTVPDDFKWVEKDEESLNDMSLSEKEAFLKKEEIKIRQSLGEAVPTTIFKSIAHKIRFAIGYIPLTNKTIERIRENYDLTTVESIYSFVKTNPLGLSVTSLSKIAEMTNTNRTDNAAYYTNKSLVTDIICSLPDTDKECIRILEPSVGVGNFIPLICKKFENKKVTIDVVDVDEDSIQLLKLLLKKLKLPKTIKINYIVDDFLLHDFDNRYDYIIGNPPFHKMSSKDGLLKIYKKYAINKSTNNICSFFLDKAQSLGDNVALVFPKFLLNTPEFAPTREYLSKKSVPCIIDFGENGFPGVLIETIALFVNNLSKPSKTKVISKTNHLTLVQSQKYIFDDAFPYWIIYRNDSFDANFSLNNIEKSI